MDENMLPFRDNGSPVYFLPCLMVMSFAGGAVYGMNVAAGAYLTDVSNEFDLNDGMKSIVSVSATVTDAIAMLLSGVFALQYFGRRVVVLFGAFCSVVGCVVGGLVTSFAGLTVARLIQGFGNGISILAVPLVVAELSSTHKRGLIVSLFQVGVVVGFAIPFAMQLGFGSWKITISSGATPALLLILMQVVLWNFTERKCKTKDDIEDDCMTYLEQNLSPDKLSNSETSEESEVDDEEDCEEGKRTSFFSAALLAILLAFVNNSSDAIIFYGPTIMQKAHLGDEDSLMTAFIVALISVPAAIIALAMVHRFRRRLILLLSLLGIVLCYFVVSIYYLSKTKGYYEILEVPLILLMVFYQFGPGTLFVVILPELFYRPKRALGMSIGTVFMSIFSVLCNGTMLVLMNAMGTGYTFLFYGILYLVCLGILFFMLPETKTFHVDI